MNTKSKLSVLGVLLYISGLHLGQCGAMSCPERCMCPFHREGLTVDCIQRQYHVVPPDISQGTFILLLTHNHLKLLKTDSFPVSLLKAAPSLLSFQFSGYRICVCPLFPIPGMATDEYD